MIPERDTSSPLWKTVLASQHVAANKGEAFSVNVIDEPSQIYAKDFINLFITKVKLSNTLRFTLIIFFFQN